MKNISLKFVKRKCGMARQADPNKIEKVKEAAIEMMIQYGYKGTSIASIAKKAGVSVGYLYRHYSGKEELIEELIASYLEETKREFEETIAKSESFYDLIYSFVKGLFELAKTDILKLKFIITLIFEYDFSTMNEKKKQEQCAMIEKMMEKKLDTENLNENTTVEDIMMVIFTIPLSFLADKIMQENYKEFLTEKLARRIAHMCFRALT